MWIALSIDKNKKQKKRKVQLNENPGMSILFVFDEFLKWIVVELDTL